MKTIIEKLKEVQSKLKAPKSQRNSFGNYNYRSCEDILEAVKPLLNENGLVLVINDEIINIGIDNYVKATASVLWEEEKIEVSAYAKEPKEQKGMSPAQITGATSSYARKYALNGLFCIDDTKDADSTNEHEKTLPKPKMSPTDAKENASRAIAEAEGDIDALSKIDSNIRKSKNLTEEDKIDLQKLIREKIEGLDPLEE